jgi:hypothetical protein
MAARDSSADWVDYFTKRLDEAKKELADFEACCAKHGLCVRNNGADVTEQCRQTLKNAVEEYQAALR